MEQRRSRSSADAELPRVRVLSLWAVVGVAVMVGFTLALLFPRQTLIEQVQTAKGSDPLTENYLANLLRTEPHNDELRVLLAEKRFEMGNIAGAREVLELATGAQDPDIRRRALLLDYRMLAQDAAPTLAEEQSRDPGRVANLHSRLAALATEQWNAQDLIFLAGESRRWGMNVIATRLTARVLAPEAHATATQIVDAGTTALGIGDYELASEFYFAAMARTDDRDQRRELFLRGVATLQSGNLLPEALAAADKHIGEFKDDEQVLTRLSSLALAAGDYVRASDSYFAAMAHAGNRDERRELFLRGVSTLQSGNLLAQALAAADKYIGDFVDDEQVLTRLTRLALAANDPARAQTYIKRLLRMSALPPAPAARRPQTPLTALATMADALLGLFASPAHAQTAPPAQPQAPRVTLRPYDEEIYNLAFDVFLANGNVEDARRVAEAAVAQRPNDMVWREKLAKASEYSGKAEAALAEWQAIAQKTGREDAWQAVLRLAPGLRDDDALLAAWQHEAGRRKLTSAEWRMVSDLYETLGRPDDGIKYLEEQYRRTSDAAILSTIATLAERARRNDVAIATLERLMKVQGPDPALAVRIATLLFLQSNFSRAYEVLQPLQASARPEDAEYWKLLADLAWQLQQDDTAIAAYGVVSGGKAAQEADMTRLVQLLRERQPEEASRIGLLAWRRFRSAQGMLAALELANNAHDYARMGQLLQEIQPQDETRLATLPFYFILRASYFQATKKLPEAMAEYRRALRLTPNAADLRISYLWLLIDARTREAQAELRARLKEWQRDALASADYWDAYAAANQILGQPRAALPWLARQSKNRNDDYVWLVNYADALEAAGEGGMALRIRRHAWGVARAQISKNPRLLEGTAAGRDAMLAYARLATAQAPGDVALAAMQRLLRQDAAAVAMSPAAMSPAAAPANAPGDGNTAETGARRLDAAATELILAWNLGEERYDAARAWMWTRYARRTSVPAWADYSLALAERDWERLARLLERDDPNVPPLVRIEAARGTGQLPLAQTLGSEAMERDPDNNDLHLRLSTDLLASASSVIARDVLFERGVLQGHEYTLRGETWTTPRLRIAAELKFYNQHSANEAQITGVPAVDRAVAVSVLLRHGVEADDGETEIVLGRRDARADFTTLSARHSQSLGPRLSGGINLGWHERADDTVPLAVAGHKDEARLGLQYRPAARQYLATQLWTSRYHTQTDGFVGDGRGVYLEAGYRIRSEYPDPVIRLSRTISHFDPSDTADAASATLLASGAIPPGSFLVPQSFRQWGLNAGFGTAFRETRSRAFRPYADIGRTANTLSGSGYNWLLGAGGAVIGPDHASVYWLRSKGGGGANLSVLELGLRYQYFFD